jgi:2-dehydro-3-deoxyphosphogluconate aldolase / (4S)-4-hydroxy-2-oxoglutarate aldolase
MTNSDTDWDEEPRPDLRSSELREVLGRDRVMAILRYRDGGDVAAAINALADGGIRVLEVTVDTPGSWDAIERAAAARPRLLVGAGTVTDPRQVRRLAAIGGRFVVSPGFDRDVVTAALDAGLEPLPGVMTGTEVLAARKAGAQFFKLFPAGALGERYLRELRGPFGAESFVPTGGVSVSRIQDWLNAGAFAVALGGELAGRTAPGQEDEAASMAAAEAMTERARVALRAAGGAA